MGTQIGLAPGELIRGWRTKADPDAFLAECYEKHNEKVRNTVSAEQFLEFNVKQGWAPLCAFLDVPIPQDEPFPFVNEFTIVAGKAPHLYIYIAFLCAPVYRTRMDTFC